MNKKKISQCGWTLALVMAAGCAAAAPITYTLDFTASGSLGNATFSNADVLLSFIGDTANVVTGPNTFPASTYSNSTGTTSISIAGVGTAAFTDASGLFSNPHDSAGFYSSGFLLDDPGLGNLDYALVVAAETIQGYNLTTALDPSGNFTLYGNFGNVVGYHTTDGVLSFTGSDEHSGRFTATTTATVPEPSSLALLMLGFTGLGLCTRRRRGG